MQSFYNSVAKVLSYIADIVLILVLDYLLLGVNCVSEGAAYAICLETTELS